MVSPLICQRKVSGSNPVSGAPAEWYQAFSGAGEEMVAGRDDDVIIFKCADRSRKIRTLTRRILRVLLGHKRVNFILYISALVECQGNEKKTFFIYWMPFPVSYHKGLSLSFHYYCPRSI